MITGTYNSEALNCFSCLKDPLFYIEIHPVPIMGLIIIVYFAELHSDTTASIIWYKLVYLFLSDLLQTESRQ